MKQLLAVLVGGVVGTALRLALDVAFPHTLDQFPVSTLIANLVGSFVLGVLVARVWPTARPWLRAGLGAGVLGSFTTFSAFAISIVGLTLTNAALSVAYLVITIAGGLLVAFAGLTLGGRGQARA